MDKTVIHVFHDNVSAVGNGVDLHLGTAAKSARILVKGLVSTTLTFTFWVSFDGVTWFNLGVGTGMDSPGSAMKTMVLDPLLSKFVRVVSAGGTPGDYTVKGAFLL